MVLYQRMKKKSSADFRRARGKTDSRRKAHGGFALKRSRFYISVLNFEYIFISSILSFDFYSLSNLYFILNC